MTRTEVSIAEVQYVLGLGLVAIAIVIGLWLGISYMEARAFERITGKHVSTWDAIWVQLRVQEAAR